MPNQDNWKLYYEKTDANPPRETLLKALALFQKEKINGSAFDMGSGACNDVEYLLSNGWTVHAVDNEPQVQDIFNNKFSSNSKASFQLASFENINWKPVHLVHAGFALAFCPKEKFGAVMAQIKDHLLVGGRFAGNFFGPEHSWDDLFLISKKEIEAIFKDFEIEWIEETKTPKTSTLGEEIHHHNISIIAKKIK